MIATRARTMPHLAASKRHTVSHRSVCPACRSPALALLVNQISRVSADLTAIRSALWLLLGFFVVGASEYSITATAVDPVLPFSRLAAILTFSSTLHQLKFELYSRPTSLARRLLYLTPCIRQVPRRKECHDGKSDGERSCVTKLSHRSSVEDILGTVNAV